MYEKTTLQSGREVELRPQKWTEHWDMQRLRLQELAATQAAMEGLAESERLLKIMEYNLIWREKPLSSCVKDWSALRDELSLPEVLELEETLKAISRVHILEGNSAPAAAVAAAAGPSTAANA